ncbi:MAG: hypothetical protein C4K58_01110 [Flavobacteriaceae bacterium]|nr:MAG: hypothetical protein C4K58_01110 [Flavobacteriaceae bacterium]
MSIKSLAALLYAKIQVKKEQKWISKPLETQKKTLKYLLKTAQNTAFGKEHHFSNIQNYQDFVQKVPLADYENLRVWIEKMVAGEKDILWPGKPLYFAKTSGTTSGSKYIPISKESMPFHVDSAKNALLFYIHQTKKANFVDGKMIFLQGSPELEEKNGVLLGRLSGISAHYVPSYLQKNREPSWEVNCMEDWEKKVEAIVEETKTKDMRLISGIPPWLIMYYEKLLEATGKRSISEIFPSLSLMVTGGVNYEPYKAKMNQLLGKKLDILQTYPASEGFIAYQIDPEKDDMLLLLNNGIYYEFISVENFNQGNFERINLEKVELGKDYVIILNTNAGLWGYNIGDTVRFTQLYPFKIKVSGRIKHFTSAFGEHVIAYEVETALERTLEKFPAHIEEFTVAPQVNPSHGLPFHQWFIEFSKEPENMAAFIKELDLQLQNLNVYYKDLIKGNVLKELEIYPVKKGSFNQYMKSIGKLGGQNKTPRLSNDRNIAQSLIDLQKKL